MGKVAFCWGKDIKQIWDLAEVKHMKEKKSEIAEYLYNEIDDCNNCPLERICDTHCEDTWLKFLTSKDMVKEGD